MQGFDAAPNSICCSDEMANHAMQRTRDKLVRRGSRKVASR
jgi:hypothetical protein